MQGMLLLRCLKRLNLIVIRFLVFVSLTFLEHHYKSNPFHSTLQIPSDKLVKVLGILEKNIQDGAKLSTLMNHVSVVFTLPLPVTPHTLQLRSEWFIT